MPAQGHRRLDVWRLGRVCRLRHQRLEGRPRLRGNENRLVDLNTLPDNRPLICEKLHGSQSVCCNNEGIFAFVAC